MRRVDWHGGSFQLTDLSYNGTYVRFNDGEIVSLRRGSCTLHGSGTIGLGGSPSDPGSACVSFEVLRFADTQPQVPLDAALTDCDARALRRRRPHQRPALRRDLPLRRRRSRCETAASGAEALELVRSWTPDLLVIDLHLPDTERLPAAAGAARRARLRRRAGLPVHRRRSRRVVEQPARDAGFDGCWTKPVELPAGAGRPGPLPPDSHSPMSFRPEPPFRHGQPARTAVLLVNLGTPDEPTPRALRRYLAEFLSDPRVVEIPRLVWWPILHGIILRTRPAKSAAKYASDLDARGLAAGGLDGTPGPGRGRAARRRAATTSWCATPCATASPRLPAVLDRLRAEGATRVLVLPLYPQYAAATTASVADAVMQWAAARAACPSCASSPIPRRPRLHRGAGPARRRRTGRRRAAAERLVLSFHGVPHRSLLLGDPYHCQCHKTARLLGERLGLRRRRTGRHLPEPLRQGRVAASPTPNRRWSRWQRSGVKRVDVMCPGFVADCLETLEEIAQEARDAFMRAGGEQFRYIPCLNDDAVWIGALTDLVERELQGWETRQPPDEAALAAQAARALALGATI